MKRLVFGAVLAFFACSLTAVCAYADGIVYVSSSGSADVDVTVVSTLSEAYSLCSDGAADEIVLLENAAYTEAPAHSGKLTLKGADAGIVLSLPSEVSLNGDILIDNVTLGGAATLYANGYTLEIGELATSSARLNVYGGKKSSALYGDTNIVLLGGLYENIYGGGNGGEVNGNTNVILGGNANAGDSINDSSGSISPCYVHGGGYGAAVSGKTNVTLEGDAVAKYLVGAGHGSGGTATDTNIYINGGKVMNVYAGSRSVTLPTGTVTHITMTGGVAEALFGGCESTALTGHTYIDLLGGEVTRRVYTGCYNATNNGLFSISYSTDRYVTGTTTLRIAPGVKLNTRSGLSFTNQINVGVFAGSRTKAQHDAEQNTVIYLDGSYSTYNGYIGDHGLMYSSSFKSFADYVIQSGEGGEVRGTNKNGTIFIAPDKGNYGTVGGVNYIDSEATVSAGTTAVTFADDFNIDSLDAVYGTDSVAATVTVTAVNAAGENSPRVLVAVYDTDTGKMLSCCYYVVPALSIAHVFETELDINSSEVTSETCTVKAMLWNGAGAPLAEAVSEIIAVE